MIKSLPQVTEGSFMRCLTAIGLYKGKIPVEQFKQFDTSGNDVRRLMKQLGIIEEEKNKYLKFTQNGQKLFEFRNEKDKFSDLLHNILMSQIPQYRVLTDFLDESSDKFFESKKSLFNLIKEKQFSYGWNLPEPTFNTLTALAIMSSLLKKESEGIYYESKMTTRTYVSLFKKCIGIISKEAKIKQLRTYDIIECFTQKVLESNKVMTLETAFNLLKTLKDDLQIQFKFGVGVENIIPGTYGITEIKEDFKYE
ncbi:MAG: hypothetical protein K9W45_11255 [Candidatus Heimdallarchaeum aukensis]|uniref:Uncharacterized protein n=1 Tax=Candidatus Heimdallarchaeum aukensis TaxID=2876573 RepID=A0A9Y1FKM4_9ARCH|nr:MAG: hypothetical protein K9W45_11255 [Candidatus Heimdallarchaeum aukensis]